MHISSSDFVTPDPPQKLLSNPDVNSVVDQETKTNIRGLQTAGWILAFLFPFLGIFINIWLLKNRNKYNINFPSTVISLTVSIILSSVLLLLLFQTIFVLITPTTV